MSGRRAPQHLSRATGAWWHEVVREYELDEHHIRLLTLAAEAWDRGQQSSRGAHSARSDLHRSPRRGQASPRSRDRARQPHRLRPTHPRARPRRRARPCPEEVVNMPRRRRFNKRRHPRRRELNDARRSTCSGGAPRGSRMRGTGGVRGRGIATSSWCAATRSPATARPASGLMRPPAHRPRRLRRAGVLAARGRASGLRRPRRSTPSLLSERGLLGHAR